MTDWPGFKAATLGRPLLGLDLGTKTIGLARSDPAWQIAIPMSTLRRRKFTLDAEALRGLIETEKVGGLILGLPTNMNGTEGPRAQASRAFAGNLKKLGFPPLQFWDERLSTVAVERELIGTGMRRERRSEVIDAEAAAFILQGALDRLRQTEVGG